MSELCVSDCATVTRFAARFDCPPSDFMFQPFLEGMTADGPEFVLKPTKADAGPLAWSMEQALSALELE
jgi:hypothetical protein